MIRNGTVFFHEHFDTTFIKFIVNQFLTLVIIVFDSKRGKHSLLIYYMGFFIPFFINYQDWELSKLYFYHRKKFQVPKS